VLPGLGTAGFEVLLSVQAALEEGATRALRLRRGELASVFYFDGPDPVFVLYDDIPGGAGLARRVHDRASDVLGAAYEVTLCQACGPGSSCYRCLRTYRNQRHHESLDRTAAGRYLAAYARG
jgi:ATP-dependent helicase YprA (DUF1998 family)